MNVQLAILFRDAAMEFVNDPPWRTFAARALLAVCRRQETVTSEDVWAELDRMGIPRPIEGRALGPVMMAALRDGLIVGAGYERGTDPKHHRDILRVYRVVR